MKKKFFSKLTLASMLTSLVTPLAVLVPQVSAAPDTCVWTGGATDHLFSSASNWSGCDGAGVPEDGDTLEFQDWVGPYNGEASNVILLTNDIPNLTVAGVISTGGGISEEYFKSNHAYQIDVLGLVDGGTLSADDDESDTSDVWVTQLNAAGNNITLDGARATNLVANQVTSLNGGVVVNPTVTTLIASSGSYIYGQVSSSGFTLDDVDNIQINNGGSLSICGTEGVAEFKNDIVLGGGSGADPTITISSCKGGGSPEKIIAVPTYAKIIFSGKIVLESDATISSQNVQSQVNGELEDNGHSLTLNAGNARIKGYGNVGTLVLGADSIVSPGSSPGCLSSTGITFESGSTYEFEIAGNTLCDEYDQIDVVGAVELGNGTLDTVLLDGFIPSLNDEYIIISNDGTDAVIGVFDGYEEGGRFEVNGVTFEISYVGGDGNDVVLTVVATPTDTNAPAAPDTGIGSILSNPSTSLIALLLTGAVLVGFRKTNLSKK